jgi:hypothetical protein
MIDDEFPFDYELVDKVAKQFRNNSVDFRPLESTKNSGTNSYSDCEIIVEIPWETGNA